MVKPISSGLLVTKYNKKCCLGIYLSARGVDDSILRHTVSPSSIAHSHQPGMFVNEINDDDAIEALYSLTVTDYVNGGLKDHYNIFISYKR